MRVSGLSEGVRSELLDLLAEDRPPEGGLLTHLRDLGRRESVPAFAATLKLLAQLEVSDRLAEQLLRSILEHRGSLARALGRDPGLPVAAMDYLSNVQRRLTHPTVVELTRLEETERSAITDSLTGLYNRRFFEAALERELRRSRRYRLGLSVAIFDLDGFKDINDRYGHLFGDLVLGEVAAVTRGGIRETDIAARYGGDEFAAIFPEADRLGAYAVAERIRTRVGRHFREREIQRRCVTLTVSGGISCYPEDGREALRLLERADASLYRAKAAGRDRVALYHAERRASVRFPIRPSAHIELASAALRAPAQGLNLSRAGALVQTRQAYRTSESVRFYLDRQDRPGAPPPWTGRGTVVRVEDGRQPPWDYRVGIAFAEPMPEWCLRAHTLPVAGEPRSQARGTS